MPARGVSHESDLGVTASADEKALLLDSLKRPSTNNSFASVQKREDRGRRGSRSKGREFQPSEQGAGIPDHLPRCSRSHPPRRYLFPHVIHDTHEACQQFRFFSSGKFLLGLLLAAFLHSGGCHPPSARFTPGARRAGRGVAHPWTRGSFCLANTAAGTAAAAPCSRARGRQRRGLCGTTRPGGPLRARREAVPRSRLHPR